MTEHHHFQIMLHQIEQSNRQNRSEARRRGHLGEARRERRVDHTHSLRSLISGLICRWSRRSSAPCSDAGVRPAQ